MIALRLHFSFSQDRPGAQRIIVDSDIIFPSIFRQLFVKKNNFFSHQSARPYLTCTLVEGRGNTVSSPDVEQFFEMLCSDGSRYRLINLAVMDVSMRMRVISITLPRNLENLLATQQTFFNVGPAPSFLDGVAHLTPVEGYEASFLDPACGNAIDPFLPPSQPSYRLG
mgnify:CR=1 FL=1